ncbi:MAG: hypothetical protein R3C09_25075 [Pirellulaceae bacterium]
MSDIEIDVIGYLRTNLRDRYKDSYATLKELVQNADDAGATDLHITTYETLGDGFVHPLLQGPCVSIVNNAPFSYNDAKAIHQAGVGSKGLTDDKIGKFGLGLKSVFHLCEAFFYCSSSTNEIAPAKVPDQRRFERNGLLNPWKGRRYSHWRGLNKDDFAQLRRLAKRRLSELNSEVPDHWFAIFLPLRVPEHCIDSERDNPSALSAERQLEMAQRWALEPKFPGSANAKTEDRLDAPEHIAQIHTVLPLLTSLARITFATCSMHSDVKTVLEAEINHQPQSDRQNWRTMSSGSYTERGVIRLKKGSSQSTDAAYAIAHILSDRKDLSELRNRKDWPWMDALHPIDGPMREKSTGKQHAAVAITDSPGNGKLSIARAVFLPLAESRAQPFNPETTCGGDRDYRITLHGYCFVDAGRLGLDEPQIGAEPTARQKWNEILFRELVLPQVIPALSVYRDQLADAPDRLDRQSRLIYGLQRALKDEFRQCVCRDHSCVFIVRGNNGGWEAVSVGIPIFAASEYSDDRGWCRKTLPAAMGQRRPVDQSLFEAIPRFKSSFTRSTHFAGWSTQARRGCEISLSD